MSVAYQALQYSVSYSLPSQRKDDVRPNFLEFFAGSGLVSHALSPYFKMVWANDICPKKAAVYWANHEGAPFDLRSITEVNGKRLPPALLSWSSFPCQDLSLAGNGEGIQAKRSGLVWEWLRIMDEMPTRPPILAAENVAGLISTNNGAHYRELHKALTERGYKVGAMLLDAVHWLPQSRPRVFVIAVDAHMAIPQKLVASGPTWAHSSAIREVAKNLEAWIWWRLPTPEKHHVTLSDVVDFSLPCHDEAASRKNLALIPPAHMRRLETSELRVIPGYKRIRKGKQVLELRFDDIAGCLRTPAGGSSRQYLVIKQGKEWKTRILSPREAARLMGAPDSYQLPTNYTDAYKAMGDAVAVPVVRHLAEKLLSPLCHALKTRIEKSS
jgi:DNA (cytosine-5)-methyltransferase 1